MGFDIRAALFYIAVVTECAVIARLIAAQIFRKYFWFAIYLTADVVRSITFSLLHLSPPSGIYRTVWSVTEPLSLLLQILVAVELYKRLGDHYRNFGRIAVRLMAGSIAAAAVICALSITIDLRSIVWDYPLARAVMFAKRCTTFILAGFLSCIAFFFLRFRLDLRTNVKRHARILSAYLVANSAGYLAIDIGAPVYTTGAALMIADAVCFFSWAVLLSRRGEEFDPPAEVGPEELERTLRKRNQIVHGIRNT